MDIWYIDHFFMIYRPIFKKTKQNLWLCDYESSIPKIFHFYKFFTVKMKMATSPIVLAHCAMYLVKVPNSSWKSWLRSPHGPETDRYLNLVCYLIQVKRGSAVFFSWPKHIPASLNKKMSKKLNNYITENAEIDNNVLHMYWDDFKDGSSTQSSYIDP